MDNLNLEFVIDKDRDSDSLDDIRIKLFNCLLDIENIDLQKNFNFFNNTILLSFLNDNNNIKLEKEEKELFLKFLDMFRQNDIFITCDKNYMEYMKIIFGDKPFTILRNRFMYCKGMDLTENQKKLIVKVNDLIKSGIGYYPDREEINNVLNLKNLRKVKIRSEKDITRIFDGKEYSNYYLMTHKLDPLNITNLKESKLLFFEYLNRSVTSKYYLIKSMIRVGMEDNLPNFSLKKVIHNLNFDNYFETVDYQTYLKICTSNKIENLKMEKFKNLEEALSFNIHLAKRGIHGILIEKQQMFHICYETTENITHEEIILMESKKIILSNFSQQEIYDYDLKNQSLYFLINITSFGQEKRDLVLPNNETLYTKNGKPIPIDILENKNLFFYNLFNDILKLEKNHYSFNRNEINIDVDVDVELIEKIDFIYSVSVKNTDLEVMLKRDIFLDGDVEIMEKSIKKLWKKGYFLTDYAIYRYRLMGLLKNQDIRFPSWFQSNDVTSYQWLISTLSSL